VALASLAYPSISVSSTSTQSVPTLVPLTNSYSTGYAQGSSTVVFAGFSTSTAWYPGNPFCDPASMACIPQPLPTSTITYNESSTYLYEVTVYSQVSTTYTSESIALSTQTSYQTIAPYAVVGLSDFQFGLSGMLILAAIVLATLIFYARYGTRKRPNPEPLAGSASVRYCTQCGAENPHARTVCGKCGANLE